MRSSTCLCTRREHGQRNCSRNSTSDYTSKTQVRAHIVDHWNRNWSASSFPGRDIAGMVCRPHNSEQQKQQHLPTSVATCHSSAAATQGHNRNRSANCSCFQRCAFHVISARGCYQREG